MRGTPLRLPYWPCDSLPMEPPPSRSSLVSWSESKEKRDRATRAVLPGLGLQRPAGAHMIDDAAPVRLGPLPGLHLGGAAHFLRPSIRRAISRAVAASFATKRAKSSGLDPTPRRPSVSNSFCTSGSCKVSRDLGLQPRHDLRRRARRQPGAEPVDHVEVLEALLLHGRHVGHALPALLAGHRERAQLALLHQRQRDLGADEEHVDVAAQQVGHGGRRALVGHLQHLDVRGGEHHFRRDVAGRSEPGLAVAELARLLARQRHQLLHGLHRQRGAHDQHLAEVLRQHGDVREVLHRVVGRVGREGRNDGVRRRGDQHGVAVRRRLGDDRRCRPCRRRRRGSRRSPICPSAVVQLGRDDAGDLVGRPARRRGHDDADQLVRVAGRRLRLRGQARAREQQRCRDGTETATGQAHGFFLQVGMETGTPLRADSTIASSTATLCTSSPPGTASGWPALMARAKCSSSARSVLMVVECHQLRLLLDDDVRRDRGSRPSSATW